MIEIDPIEVLERNYQPHESASAWLRAMSERLQPALGGEGNGVFAYFMTPDGPRHQMLIEAEGSPIRFHDVVELTTRGIATCPPEGLARLADALQVPGYSTLIEATGFIVENAFGFVDSPAVVVVAGEGPSAVIATYTRRRPDVGEATRRIWRRLALHLGAGLRLLGRSRQLDADDVEAIVDHRGAVVHATGEATRPESLDAIREAVVRVDRARTRGGRSDPHAALELWQALLEGRWSLVEQFDSDGRRYITARQNDPSIAEPRGLTRRQRQVVFYAGLGWSLKEIGYALGLATSTVHTHLSGALDQLGLRSRTDLIRIQSALAVMPGERDS